MAGATAATGHNLPVTLSTNRTPKSLLHSDTCRMLYFGNSAEAVAGGLNRLLPLWIAYRIITFAPLFLGVDNMGTGFGGPCAKIKNFFETL